MQIRAQFTACKAPLIGDSMYTVAAIAEMTNPGLNPFGKYKKDFTSTPVHFLLYRYTFYFSQTGTLLKCVPVWLEIVFYTGTLVKSVLVLYLILSPSTDKPVHL
jgi:hypothetical protein